MIGICIITGAHLCRNPRVVKEATTLANHGYDVTVLGPCFSDALSIQDKQILNNGKWRHLTSVNLCSHQSSWFKTTRLRASWKLGAEAARLFRWDTAQAIGYGSAQTLKLAKAQKYDLYIGHQELGAWVACELAKTGKRIGADLEDWYSRDLLPEAQAGRPLKLLRQCEGFLLQTARHVTTTSNAMSSALSAAYNSSKPATIYNAFPLAERAEIDNQAIDRSDYSLPSLHWFSQTIGLGRGLETLCSALGYLEKPVAVHLRGAYSQETETWLRKLFPFDRGHTLNLHDLVAPAELLSRIAEHDIGLALEMKSPDSRNYTVTNKILQYLLGGLAVVATDTAGQREIAEATPDAVRLCRNEDSRGLARVLNQLLANIIDLAKAKSAALEAAKNIYCWERQEPILLESVEKALYA